MCASGKHPPAGNEASFHAAASRVNAIAYSPDGNGLAIGSQDGPIGLWDSRNGNPAGILRGHTDPVFEVAFNNDGTKLISAGQHATIKALGPGIRPRSARFSVRKYEERTWKRALTAMPLLFAGVVESPFGRTERRLPPPARMRRLRSGVCDRGISSEPSKLRWAARSHSPMTPPGATRVCR